MVDRGWSADPRRYAGEGGGRLPRRRVGAGGGMTALIETVRVKGGKAPLWPYHLVRLARSAKALGVTVPTLVSPSGGGDRVMRYAIKSGGFTVVEREVGSVAAVKLGVAPAGYRAYPHKVEER